MSELSVALVGLGRAGKLHLPAWTVQTGIRIAAVCDTDGNEAARVAAEHPGAAAFQSYRAMLDGAAYDIVDVCVPPEQHYEIVEAAVRAGAHVVCEKPLTTSVEQARALAQSAAQRERLLMPAFCHRFHGPVLFLKELLDNDDIGRPLMFRSRFSGYYAPAPSPTVTPEQAAALLEAAEREANGRTGKQENRKIGEQPIHPSHPSHRSHQPEHPTPNAHHPTPDTGVLLDTAIHSIDLFRYLVGEVSGISGAMSRFNIELPGEDTVALWLRSEGEAVGVIEASWSTPGGRSVLELYASAGAAVIDYDTGEMSYTTADHPVWQQRHDTGPNRFERELAHFADAVRGLQPLAVTSEDGLRAVELCLEVYRQNLQNLDERK